MTSMNKFVSILLLFLSSFVFAQDFILGKHYFEIKTLAPQKEPEIRYFFGFFCPSCQRFSGFFQKSLDELHLRYGVSIHSTPMTNQQQLQLAYAYYFLKETQQESYLPTLFEMGKQTESFQVIKAKKPLEKEQVIGLLERQGCQKLGSWTSEANLRWNKTIKEELDFARKAKITALPIFIVIGPKGAFYVVPTSAAPPDQIPYVLDYLINLHVKDEHKSTPF